MSTTCQPRQLKSIGNAPRILIVDDNRDIHSDFRKILNTHLSEHIDEEFEQLDALFTDSKPAEAVQQPIIDSAFQGACAVEMVKKAAAEGRPYSLAFVDVRMPPGCDGIETTRMIWQCDPEIQVVICSAFSDYSWHQIVKELNYSDRFLVLKKPFDNIEIRQLVSVLHNRWFEGRSDGLTALLNRKAFMNHLQQRLVARSSKTTDCCIMVDLDHFKRINDSFGHLIGDDVLRAAAGVLLKNCEGGNLASRFGGEEFCVLLKNCNEAQGQQWADQTRKELAQLDLQYEGTRVGVTASFGVAELQEDFEEVNQWVDAADHALLAAKRTGRNRVSSFTELTERIASSDLDPHLLFENVNAGQAMKPVVMIDNDASFGDAAKVMMDCFDGSMPVVGNNGKMVGMLTEQDLIRGIGERDLSDIAVAQLMNSSVVCYPAETPLVEIYKFLAKVAIPQVVILVDGKPSGVIGRKALLEWLIERGFGLPSTIANE